MYREWGQSVGFVMRFEIELIEFKVLSFCIRKMIRETRVYQQKLSQKLLSSSDN